MLKTRVLPTLLFKDFGLIKGMRFDHSRRVGSLMQAVKVYNLREVDELVFLDVGASLKGTGPDLETIAEIARESFVPLTVGGGIRNLEDIRKVIACGADKVSLNTQAFLNPSLIKEAVGFFGSQAVVVSIDVQKNNVFISSGSKNTKRDVLDWALEAESLGAGEILLTSIEKDGTMSGYDLDLIQRVASRIKIPLIASGGAGCYEDMFQALQVGAKAVAAASMFHFTQQTPLEAKKYLKEKGIQVRLN